jgi:V8-like Glu-specific endopeptidase
MRLGLSLCVGVLAVVSGCAMDDEATENVGRDEAEKIIGANDLVSVIEDGANIPAKYAPLIDGFGRLSNGCTATHLGNGLAITAGHCFRSPSTRRDNHPCGSYSVKWGFRKDKAPYMVSQCQIVLAGEQNRDRDYAIFVVRPIPPVSVAITSKARPALNQSITIFSHPRSRPLEWSQTCTVQPNTNGPYGVDMFTHQCDTEGGSSGASILDDETLKVIGIHDGGRVPWNYATYLADTPIDEFTDGYNVPPAVTFTAPTAATVTGTIDVSVTATDLEDGPVTGGVSFKLPDGAVKSISKAPYLVQWDTTVVADGTYTIEATAKDSTGLAMTTTKKITVKHPAAPPPPPAATETPAPATR